VFCYQLVSKTLEFTLLISINKFPSGLHLKIGNLLVEVLDVLFNKFKYEKTNDISEVVPDI
jgi:hypothetical protein